LEESMSTKFWNRVLEADMGNIYDFQQDIEESKEGQSKITLKILADAQINNEFGDLSSQLETVPGFNKAMILQNDEPPIVNFKEELKEDLGVLNNQIMEEYDLMKEYFSAEVVQKLKERKKCEEIDIQNESAKVGDVALIRDNLKIQVNDNDRWLSTLHLKRPDRKLKQKVFNVFKKNFEFKKFCQNNELKIKQNRERKLLQRIIDVWRADSHQTYTKSVIEKEPIYYQK